MGLWIVISLCVLLLVCSIFLVSFLVAARTGRAMSEQEADSITCIEFPDDKGIVLG